MADQHSTGEVTTILPHLLLASEAHRDLGQELQDKVEAFRRKFAASLDLTWQHKAQVDSIKDKLIGEEERTREVWLNAQRQAAGLGGMPQESSVGETSAAPALTKPVIGEWSGKSPFLRSTT